MDYDGLQAPAEDVAAAREVKDDHGETWGDVMQFYAAHGPHGGEVDRDAISAALARIEEQLAERDAPLTESDVADACREAIQREAYR